MCWLYTGTFGSFIGYSAGFPLLAKTQFPEVERARLRVPRPAGRRAVALAHGLGVGQVRRRPRHLLGVRRAWPSASSASSTSSASGSWLRGFFAMFLFLFFASGVGNASTFQMIPAIMRKEMDRLMPTADAATRVEARRTRKARRSSASPRRSRPTAPSSSRRATAPRSAMTGGAAGGAVGLLRLLPQLHRHHLVVLHAHAAGCCATSSGGLAVAVRPRARRSTSRMIGSTTDEPLPRPPHLLQARRRRLRRRPRHHHQRGPALGGRLPQALAARQDRALHARRQLHRLVLVEDLRQGRHRHLGDAADRLSAHAPGPAQPRAARLLAGRQLQLVSLFRQPGEVPAGALAPAQAVARGARDA